MLKVTNNSDAITLWDGSTGINAATFIAALNTLEVFTIYTWGIISDAGAQGGDFLRIFDNSTGNPILRHSMRDVSGELGVQSRVRTVTGGEQAGFIAGSTEIASGDWYVSGLHVDLRTTASGGGNSFVGVHADGGSVQDDPIDMTDLGGLEEPSAANARWFLADPGAGAAALVQAPGGAGDRRPRAAGDRGGGAVSCGR